MMHTHIGTCSRQSSKRGVASKRIMVLLLGASGLGLVPGCSFVGMKNPFSSERPDQIVAGTRHPPALNAGGSGFGATPLPSQAAPPPSSGAPDFETVSSEGTVSSPRVNGYADTTASHVRKPIPGNPGVAAAPSTYGAADATFVTQSPKPAVHASNSMPVDTALMPQLKPSNALPSHKEAPVADDNTLPPFSLSYKPVEHASKNVSVDNDETPPQPLQGGPSHKQVAVADDNTPPPVSLSPKPVGHVSNTTPVDTTLVPQQALLNAPPSHKETAVTDDNTPLPVSLSPKPVEHASNTTPVDTTLVPQQALLNAAPSHKEAVVADDNTPPPVSLSSKPVEPTSNSTPVDTALVPQQEPLKAASSRNEVSVEDSDMLPPWRKRNSYTFSGGKSESGNSGAVPVVSPEVLNDDKNTEKTPALSSVPANPFAFKDIKQDRKPQLEALQSEHTKAQEERAALAVEPAQQQGKIVPEEMPLAEKSAPVLVAPVATAVDSAPAAPGTPQGTPKRGIDIMTQAEWETLQKSRQEAPAALTSPATPVEAPAK